MQRLQPGWSERPVPGQAGRAARQVLRRPTLEQRSLSLRMEPSSEQGPERVSPLLSGLPCCPAPARRDFRWPASPRLQLLRQWGRTKAARWWLLHLLQPLERQLSLLLQAAQHLQAKPWPGRMTGSPAEPRPGQKVGRALGRQVGRTLGQRLGQRLGPVSGRAIGSGPLPEMPGQAAALARRMLGPMARAQQPMRDPTRTPRLRALRCWWTQGRRQGRQGRSTGSGGPPRSPAALPQPARQKLEGKPPTLALMLGPNRQSARPRCRPERRPAGRTAVRRQQDLWHLPDLVWGAEWLHWQEQQRRRAEGRTRRH